MPSFRTKLPLVFSNLPIHHQNSIFLIGSCFAEHIGQKLEEWKFDVERNPFGILYNPVSIAQAIERIWQNQAYNKSELFFHLGHWHSYDHHSAFSHPKLEQALDTINRRLDQAHQYLHKANRLLITFGTAWVFNLIEDNRIVGNCHKMPGELFQRERLGINEITNHFRPIFEKLKIENENLEIILTVSPVRHIRTGLIENQKSKATLLLAIEALQQELNFVHYFPAYELLLDDLRDYRFYEADMIHPNSQAIQYIWEQFQMMHFEEPTKAIGKEVEKIVKASTHRPFHPDTDQHQAFLQKQLAQIQILEQKYPFLDFKKEQEIFEKQLR